MCRSMAGSQKSLVLKFDRPDWVPGAVIIRWWWNAARLFSRLHDVGMHTSTHPFSASFNKLFRAVKILRLKFHSVQQNNTKTFSLHCRTLSSRREKHRIYQNKRPSRNKRPPKTVIFKGGSTQNRWALMGDFSKGGLHETDGLWWVIFQRGEYTKPRAFDGWFSKGGSTQNRWVLMDDFSQGGVHKTEGFWWVIFQRGEYTKPMAFFIASKNWAPGAFISANTIVDLNSWYKRKKENWSFELMWKTHWLAENLFDKFLSVESF